MQYQHSCIFQCSFIPFDEFSKMRFAFCAIPFLFHFSIFLPNQNDVTALDAPQWVLQRKWERFERNEKCMKRQRDELDYFGLQPFRPVLTTVNDTLWLHCFECLHADSAEELEDLWKPSPSFIGRAIHKFLKVVKKLARPGKKGKKVQNEQPLGEYRWERLENGEWKAATRRFEKPTKKSDGKKESETVDFIDEIMSKGNSKTGTNKFIGDHLELEIRRLKVADGGWYRCSRRREEDDRLLNISQIYHVEVQQKWNISMTFVNSSEFENDWTESQGKIADGIAANVSIPGEFEKMVEIYGRTSEWTPCNKCGGDRVGESRRTLACSIRRKKQSQVDNGRYRRSANFRVFLAFGELPCRSSMVPKELAEKIPKELLVVHEEFRECKSNCTPTQRNQRETRNVTTGELEKPEVLDMLPPGEFSVRERLPPLPPPIIRRTIFASESQHLRLDCSNQDGLSLIWRKNFEELNGSRILAEAKNQWVLDEQQRRHLTAEGRFIIESIAREDAGLYSCTAFPSGHILRTFRVYFVAGDRTKELLEYLSLIFRALLFIYMLILMCDLLSVHVPNA